MVKYSRKGRVVTSFNLTGTDCSQDRFFYLLKKLYHISTGIFQGSIFCGTHRNPKHPASPDKIDVFLQGSRVRGSAPPLRGRSNPVRGVPVCGLPFTVICPCFCRREAKTLEGPFDGSLSYVLPPGCHNILAATKGCQSIFL